MQYYVRTAIQTLSKSTKARTSNYNFSEVCETKKIKKKNMKKISRTVKAHISVVDGRIHLKFGMGGALSQGSFHSKNGPAIIKLRMCENVFY